MRTIAPVRRVEARAEIHDANVVDLLQSIVTEQAQQRALLVSILRLLERGRGPRDDGDIALVRTIAAVSGGLPITSASVFRRAACDETLAAALEAADIGNPTQLGKLLRRLGECDVEGIRLHCVGANREGHIWQATVQA